MANTTERIVDALDALSGEDPDAAHSDADDLLLQAVPDSIRAAYQRVRDCCRWWATG